MMFRSIKSLKLMKYQKRRFCEAKITKLSIEYYDKVFEESIAFNDIKHKQIQHKDVTGNVLSIIDIYGIPYQKLETDENTTNEKLKNILTKSDDTLTFLQIEPTKYLYWRRTISNKINQENLKSQQIEKLLGADPLYPLDWEECLTNKYAINFKDLEKFDQPNEHQMQSKENLTSEEAFNKYIEKLSSEENLKEFTNSIRDNITDGKDYIYPDLYDILVYELLLNRNIILGDIPKFLNRMLIANSVSLKDMQDMFKILCTHSKSIKNKGLTLSEAANIFFRNVFQVSRDLYMTIMLRNIAKITPKFRVIVGIDHVAPIIDSWDNDEIQDVSFGNAVGLPRRRPEDRLEVLLEKHVLLDILLEENIWNSPYLQNQFPYLTKEELKDENIKDIKKKFYIIYKRYSELKTTFNL